MSTWSRITVSCLVSLSNRPSAVIARTLYGKSFKYSFSRRHRIHMRVPSHFCDILTFLRIIALFFFLLFSASSLSIIYSIPIKHLVFLPNSIQNFQLSLFLSCFSFSPFSTPYVYLFLFLSFDNT